MKTHLGFNVADRVEVGPWPTLARAMLNYALVFLMVALLAGVLGFGVVAGTAAVIAKVLFVIFLICFIAALLRGARPR